jgi:hypothetical protein
MAPTITCNKYHQPHPAATYVNLKITLRLERVPVLWCGRGPPEGAAEAAPSPAPETEPKNVDAALAIAPAPAERAAPPAATIPPAFAVAAAPTAAPALQRTKK